MTLSFETKLLFKSYLSFDILLNLLLLKSRKLYDSCFPSWNMSPTTITLETKLEKTDTEKGYFRTFDLEEVGAFILGGKMIESTPLGSDFSKHIHCRPEDFMKCGRLANTEFKTWAQKEKSSLCLISGECSIEAHQEIGCDTLAPAFQLTNPVFQTDPQNLVKIRLPCIANNARREGWEYMHPCLLALTVIIQLNSFLLADERECEDSRKPNKSKGSKSKEHKNSKSKEHKDPKKSKKSKKCIEIEANEFNTPGALYKYYYNSLFILSGVVKLFSKTFPEKHIVIFIERVTRTYPWKDSLATFVHVLSQMTILRTHMPERLKVIVTGNNVSRESRLWRGLTETAEVEFETRERHMGKEAAGEQRKLFFEGVLKLELDEVGVESNNELAAGNYMPSPNMSARNLFDAAVDCLMLWLYLDEEAKG